MSALYALRFISMKRLILFWSLIWMVLWLKMMLEDLSVILVEKNIYMMGMTNLYLLLLKMDIILYGWLWDQCLYIIFQKVIFEVIHQSMAHCWLSLKSFCQLSRNKLLNKLEISKPTWCWQSKNYSQAIEIHLSAASATEKTTPSLTEQLASN